MVVYALLAFLTLVIPVMVSEKWAMIFEDSVPMMERSGETQSHWGRRSTGGLARSPMFNALEDLC